MSVCIVTIAYVSMDGAYSCPLYIGMVTFQKAGESTTSRKKLIYEPVSIRAKLINSGVASPKSSIVRGGVAAI